MSEKRLQKSWESYRDFFGPKETEGSYEERQQLAADLKLEWARYLQVLCLVKVQTLALLRLTDPQPRRGESC